MAGTAAQPGRPVSGWESGCGQTLVRVTDALTWHRPLYSLAVFICCNFLFWFLAFTPWRIYHLSSLISIGLVMVQIIKHFLLSRSQGARLWRGIVRSLEVENIPSLQKSYYMNTMCTSTADVL